MNMPNMLKMSKLPNCWLIMEFVMVMNSMELIEWLWHDLPLNLISYVELGKFMKWRLIAMIGNWENLLWLLLTNEKEMKLWTITIKVYWKCEHEFWSCHAKWNLIIIMGNDKGGCTLDLCAWHEMRWQLHNENVTWNLNLNPKSKLVGNMENVKG